MDSIFCPFSSKSRRDLTNLKEIKIYGLNLLSFLFKSRRDLTNLKEIKREKIQKKLEKMSNQTGISMHAQTRKCFPILPEFHCFDVDVECLVCVESFRSHRRSFRSLHHFWCPLLFPEFSMPTRWISFCGTQLSRRSTLLLLQPGLLLPLFPL